MRFAFLLTTFVLLAACAESHSPTPAPTPTDPFAAAREELVETGVIGYGIEDPAVIQAMRAVPRHRFVPPEYWDQAYENHPLPIGYGQTISQPYIVALMTEALELEPGDRVLEIGTGSGYQAAVLAELVQQVYSIEIIGDLARRARDVLDRLGYEQVKTRVGDGYYGWEEQAPFDAIVVTAAADHVPPPLIKQLKPGGRMMIPVGSRFMTQQLVLITKGEDEITTQLLLPVRFVPLTGEH